MTKFNKAYNLKTLAVVLAMLLVWNSTLYSLPSSEEGHSLRVHMQKETMERMEEAYKNTSRSSPEGLKSILIMLPLLFITPALKTVVMGQEFQGNMNNHEIHVSAPANERWAYLEEGNTIAYLPDIESSTENIEPDIVTPRDPWEPVIAEREAALDSVRDVLGDVNGGGFAKLQEEIRENPQDDVFEMPIKLRALPLNMIFGDYRDMEPSLLDPELAGYLVVSFTGEGTDREPVFLLKDQRRQLLRRYASGGFFWGEEGGASETSAPQFINTRELDEFLYFIFYLPGGYYSFKNHYPISKDRSTSVFSERRTEDLNRIRNLLSGFQSDESPSPISPAFSIVTNPDGSLNLRGAGVKDARKIRFMPLDNIPGAFTPKAPKKMPKDITIVYDHSGSVDSTEAVTMKRALASFLKTNMTDSINYRLIVLGPGSKTGDPGNIGISEALTINDLIEKIPVSAGNGASYLWTNVEYAVANTPEGGMIIVLTDNDGEGDSAADEIKGPAEPGRFEKQDNAIKKAKESAISTIFVGIGDAVENGYAGFLNKAKADSVDVDFAYAGEFGDLEGALYQISGLAGEVEIEVPREIPCRLEIVDSNNELLYEQTIGRPGLALPDSRYVQSTSVLTLEGRRIRGEITIIEANGEVVPIDDDYELIGADLNLRPVETLIPQNAGKQKKDLFVILDRSFSMGGAKMNHLKSSVNEFLSNETIGNVTLFSFGERVEKLFTGSSKDSIKLHINSLIPVGATAGYPALKEAFVTLEELRSRGERLPEAIVVFSDGRFTKGTISMNDLLDLASLCKENNIRLFFIGEGSDYENTNMHDIEFMLSYPEFLFSNYNKAVSQAAYQLATITGGEFISVSASRPISSDIPTISESFRRTEQNLFSFDVNTPEMNIQEITLVFKNKKTGEIIRTNVRCASATRKGYMTLNTSL